MDKERDSKKESSNQTTVDGLLYDGFFDNHDRQEIQLVRKSSPAKISLLKPEFHDARLIELFPLYIARNYPNQLSGPMLKKWQDFCRNKLLGGGENSRLSRYLSELAELTSNKGLAKQQKTVLKDLVAWAKQIDSNVR